MKKIMIALLMILLIPIIYAEDCHDAITVMKRGYQSVFFMNPVDIDDDGDIDVIVPDITNDKLWMLENINGFFLNYTVLSPADGVYSTDTYDYDDDGDLDIIAVNSEQNKCHILRNDGYGIFTDAINFNIGTGAITVLSYDFDNDGDMEIIVGASSLNRIEYYENDGNNAFSLFDTSSFNVINKLQKSDIDKDGLMDFVAFAYAGTAGISYFENKGNMIFYAKSLTTTSKCFDGDIGDIDDDGNIDVACGSSCSSGECALQWYKNNGFESFEKINITNYNGDTSKWSKSTKLGDMDNDGDLDIISNEVNNIVLWTQNSINDWSRNNLTDYTLLNAFTAPQIADMNGDGFKDVLYYQSILYEVGYIDGLQCEHIPLAGTGCTYPQIFCDDFNYDTPLAGKLFNIWNAVEFDSSVNLTFAPIDNKLNLNQTKFYSPRHLLEAFPVNYSVASNEKVIESTYAPVFSTEFEITPLRNNFTYMILDKTFASAVTVIKGANTTGTDNKLELFIMDNTDNYVMLCQDCMTPGYESFIKITAYFVDSKGNHFNSSFANNSVTVYLKEADNTEHLFTGNEFVDETAVNQKLQIFIKNPDDGFIVDNYYVYIGTDKIESNVDNYYDELYIPPDETTTTIGTGEPSDLATSISSIWSDMGLKSTASRVITGLFLMVICAIAIMGVYLSHGQAPSGIVIGMIEVFLIMLLTYIRLIPPWLPFVLVFISAGIGIVIFKMSSS